MILSKAELQYLKTPENFTANYSKVLRSRIRIKVSAFNQELSVLANAGLLSANCNPVTENRNPPENQSSLNQAAYGNWEGGPSRIRTGGLWRVKPTS